MKKRIISLMMTVVFLLALVTPFDTVKANETNKVLIDSNHLTEEPNLTNIRANIPAGMVDIMEFEDNESFTIQKEDLSSRDYVNGDFKVTLTIGINNNEKKTMDWSIEQNSKYQIYYVFVKAANGGYLYWYNNGETSDAGLHGLELQNEEGYHGISHVVFFYKEKEENPPQQDSARIIVAKHLRDNGLTPHQLIDIILKKDNQIIGTQTTGTDGLATFEKLAPGVYTIEEGMSSNNYANDLPRTVEIKGTEVCTVNVVNIQTNSDTGVLQVLKMNSGVDGVIIGYAEGVTFNLYNSPLKEQDEEPVGTAVTDADGYAVFRNIAPGNYTLEEIIPEGYTTSLLKDKVYTIEAGKITNEYVTNKQKPGSIIITKTKKAPNPNGEGFVTSPHEGVTFKITDGKNTIPDQVTDSNGIAEFTNLVPGDYRIEEIVPIGYTSSLENNSTSVTVAPGQQVPITVTNTRNNDVQTKGTLKITKNIKGGVPQDKVQFILTKADETPKLKINSEGNNPIVGYTNSNGILEFTDLEYGRYTLEEIVPEGFEIEGIYVDGDTKPLMDTNPIDITIDSPELNINFVNQVDLNEGEEFVSGKISGYKFYDKNENRRWDEGEEKLPNWRIELYKVVLGGEEFVKDTTTDSNGDYSFENIIPGNYYIREKIEDKTKNWRMTQPVESNGYQPMIPAFDIPTLKGSSIFRAKYLEGDADLSKIMPYEAFAAEGRIGMDGPEDYELDISQNGQIKDQEEYTWPNNGTPVSFKLECNRKTGYIKYTVKYINGKEIKESYVAYTMETPIDECTDIIIRTQSTNSGTGIVLNNLRVNKNTNNEIVVGKYSSTIDQGSGVLLIRTNGLFDDDGIFVLEGDSLMFWGDVKPQYSNLSYQIKVGKALSEANLDHYKFNFGNTYDSIIDPSLPDIAVTKTDNNKTVQPGEKVTYRIKVTNNGKEDVTNVYVHETLPLYTSFISESGYNEGWASENQPSIASHIRKQVNLEQQLGYYYIIKSLKPSESREILFTVRLNDKDNLPSDLEKITNTVIVEIDSKESNYENNTATDTTPIEFPVTPPQPPQPPTPPTVVLYPDLTISKTDGNITAKPGDEVEYKITVKNSGDTSAFNVKVYEKLPEHTSIVEDKNSKWKLENEKYVYEIGTLSKDEVKEIKFVVRVDSNIPDTIKKIINNVEVKTTSTEYRSNNNTASDDTPIINPTVEIVSPLLEVIKTDDGITAINGESIIYKITVVNKGNGKAEEVKLFEKVPEYTTFDEAVNSGWVKSGEGYVLEIGTLEAGKSKTVEFEVVVDESISYSINKINNTVVLSAKGLDDIDASDDTDIIISTPPVLPETGRTNNVDIFAGIFAVILLAAGILIRKIK